MQYTKTSRIEAMSRLFEVLADDERCELFINLLMDLSEEDDVRVIYNLEDIITSMLYSEYCDEDIEDA